MAGTGCAAGRRHEVTIAVMTFLRFGDKYKVKPAERIPQGKMSLHLEEQKLPPMGDNLVFRDADGNPIELPEPTPAPDPGPPPSEKRKTAMFFSSACLIPKR